MITLPRTLTVNYTINQISTNSTAAPSAETQPAPTAFLALLIAVAVGAFLLGHHTRSN